LTTDIFSLSGAANGYTRAHAGRVPNFSFIALLLLLSSFFFFFFLLLFLFQSLSLSFSLFSLSLPDGDIIHLHPPNKNPKKNTHEYMIRNENEN
jgi:hypothetical protein